MPRNRVLYQKTSNPVNLVLEVFSFKKYIVCEHLIPFLNDSISLTKNAFVVAQFIAPLTFKMSYISVMVFYFSELVFIS